MWRRIGLAMVLGALLGLVVWAQEIKNPDTQEPRYGHLGHPRSRRNLRSTLLL